MKANYTSLAPVDISQKLKEIGYTKNHGYQYDADGNLVDPAAPGGYPGVCEAPTYAEVFDFLMDKGITVLVVPSPKGEIYNSIVFSKISKQHTHLCHSNNSTWTYSADEAIRKALEIYEDAK